MSTTTIYAQGEKRRKASKPFPFSAKQRFYLIAQAIGFKTTLLLSFVLLLALALTLGQVISAKV